MEFRSYLFIPRDERQARRLVAWCELEGVNYAIGATCGMNRWCLYTELTWIEWMRMVWQLGYIPNKYGIKFDVMREVLA